MANLLEFENPISGKKGNILDFPNLWANILGVFVLFLVFAMGQNVSNFVTSKVPMMDTKIDPLYSAPVPQGTKRMIY